MGPNAVIISSNDISLGNVEVTAAVERVYSDNDILNFPLPNLLNEIIEDFSEICKKNDISEKIINEWISIIRNNSSNIHSITDVFESIFSFEPISIDENISKNPLVFLGPNGMGKTTLIGKIAAQCVIKKKDVIIATNYSKNEHYNDKITAYSNALKVPIHRFKNREDLRKIYTGKNNETVMLVDTFGESPENTQGIYKIKDLTSSIPSNKILVISSNSNPYQIHRYCNKFSDAFVSSIALTGIDMTISYGSLMMAASYKGMSVVLSSDAPTIDKFIIPLTYKNFEELLRKNNISRV